MSELVRFIAQPILGFLENRQFLCPPALLEGIGRLYFNLVLKDFISYSDHIIYLFDELLL